MTNSELDLGKRDSTRRWTNEANGLDADELYKKGLDFLKETTNNPPPWKEVVTTDSAPEDWLLQGDLLENIGVPVIDDMTKLINDGYSEMPIDEGRFVVLTQSCDLGNRKAPMVACCPAHTLDEFENANEFFKRKGKWEEVRRGKHTSLHLLPGGDPEQNRECLVVDFRVVHSLPIDYVIEFIQEKSRHFRLRTPYVEHMSQAFARVFMRVGLPTNIPKFS